MLSKRIRESGQLRTAIALHEQDIDQKNMLTELPENEHPW